MHGIGSVADDDTVDSFLDLLADGHGQLHVLLGAHVFAENGKELLRCQVADIGQFRHRTVEFTRREGRDHGPGTIIKTGSDRAAGSEKLDAGLVVGKGKFLLGYLIVGFFVTLFGHVFDRLGGNTDIVARVQLQDNVPLVVVLGARQDNAPEIAPTCLDVRLGPHPDVERLEYGQRLALVTLEQISHCPTPYRCGL